MEILCKNKKTSLKLNLGPKSLPRFLWTFIFFVVQIFQYTLHVPCIWALKKINRALKHVDRCCCKVIQVSKKYPFLLPLLSKNKTKDFSLLIASIILNCNLVDIGKPDTGILMNPLHERKQFYIDTRRLT